MSELDLTEHKGETLITSLFSLNYHVGKLSVMKDFIAKMSFGNLFNVKNSAHEPLIAPGKSSGLS